MKIDSIQNGYVIDHITAGKCMKIYQQLDLDSLDCSIAIIKNVKSERMGKKDIIKIDQTLELDFDVLGCIDPDITINVIENGVRIEKRRLSMPERVVNVMVCKNPRCITRVEQEIEQVFVLKNAKKGIYRCVYCESAHRE